MTIAKKYLFIDRDGTIINEAPPTYQIDDFSKLSFYPMVFQFLRKIVLLDEYSLVMITNQDGLGTKGFKYEDFQPVHDFIMQAFEAEGIHFEEVLIDVTFPAENAPTRKPQTGLLINYIGNDDVDLENSFVIGDRITDIQLAKNLGCKGIWLNVEEGLGVVEISDTMEELRKETIALETKEWEEIYSFLNEANR
jgi:imidazoleglycerol-phosphate dehydratase/histidinol-phosphatase